ncbi:MAG: type II toxin-antitoxin system HipA family toxin [Clostridiales Family XIII bacterium]|jgi:serine/threonine-protein kinase HipA|nr:type II toxin-antitoxin system HipA family toxin [Clostridiales Family XIII bacterium]
MDTKKIYVSMEQAHKTVLVGTIWFHFRGGKQSASFEYSRTWLDSAESFALEPALKLSAGAYHTADNRLIFGAIGDSAPDRWGRTLMRRAESTRAADAGQTARTLTEMDYLLGVSDEGRQGALRFSEEPSGPYLALPAANAIPPFIDLPKLLSASENYMESTEDLRLLLAPGSSLGGARPKALVRDRDGSLAIAKFPKEDDGFNIVVWESVALRLAAMAGISVPRWRVEYVLKKPVLLVTRFDRTGNGGRIPFLSAMSMLGALDNEQHSYLEMAYALEQYGAEPQRDLAELWRRIVFNVLISNTDDHLRNHGFLYSRYGGWELSPIYDVNAAPAGIKPRFLSTSINFADNAASLDLALSVAPDFRLTEQKACAIAGEVAKSVVQWQEVAKAIKAPKSEMDFMSSAFTHHDLEQAARMF